MGQVIEEHQIQEQRVRAAGKPAGPLKILLLSHRFFPDIGGIEVNSEIYAREFAAAGHEVRLMTWSTLATKDTFPFVVVRNPSKRTLVREHTWADVVFENNPCVRLAWPGLFLRRPAVITLNTELYRGQGAGWRNQKLLKTNWLRRAKSVIAVSEALRQKYWPAAAVIGNPYRSDEFKMLPDVERTGDFVFLGRLVSQKGVSQSIEAFHRVLVLRESEDPGAKKLTLTIIGDGPERASLERLVATLGLEAHVHFVGFLQGEALVRELNRHRFMLVPSLYGEAFGNVVLEGMACGCVPLVSSSGGLPDAAGKGGLVFRRGNVDAQAACIWRILHTPALEWQLRQAAEDHLADHQPELVSERYLQVLCAAGHAA